MLGTNLFAGMCCWEHWCAQGRDVAGGMDPGVAKDEFWRAYSLIYTPQT